MRVNILTIFLSLLIVSFSSVLLFLRYKNFESIEELAQGRMHLVEQEINGKIENLFNSAEDLVESSANLFSFHEKVDPQNQELRTYMLSVARSYPNIAYFYIGTAQGGLIQVGNLSLSRQENYTSKSASLPENAAYKWKVTEFKGNATKQTIYYFDSSLKEVGEETFMKEHYNPRERPWFVGAKQKRGLFWTDVYTFFDTQRPGLTVSMPLIDSNGKFLGVIAADLSFDLLSKFFLSQKIGKTGKPFIINTKGDIVIPDSFYLDSSPISKNVVEESFILYKKNKRNDFRFQESDTRYLTHIEPFPLPFRRDWLIAIIVPFEDFFGEFEDTQQDAIFMVVVILFIASVIVIFFANRISKPIKTLASAVDSVRQLDFSKEERIHSRIEEIHLMDDSIASMRSAVRSFTRYVPKEIVQQLLSQNKEITLGGEKKEVSILFSDIANFTSIAEEHATEELMPLLAEYFDILSKAILESKGTIDKYIGDSIMAFWGAPTDLENQVEICAEAALYCKMLVHEFNKKRSEQNQPLFETRFGINTGVAIVGNIGTPERMNYTLIGDTVNIASRLQQKNKMYHTEILITQTVREKLGARFLTRPLDVAEVKGKKEKIALYELVALQGGSEKIAPQEKTIELCKRFAEAFDLFQKNDKAKAEELLLSIQQEFPDDYPTQEFLKRIKNQPK